MTKKSAIVGLAFVGLLTGWWCATRITAHVRAEWEALTRAQRMEKTAIQRAADRRAEALQQCAEIEKAISTLQKAADRPIQQPSGGTVVRIPTIEERLRTEPDAQVLWLKLQEAQVMKTYGPFFRSAGLTTEQISRFRENIFLKQEQQMDLKAISTEQKEQQGSVPADTAEMLQRVDRDYLAAQRALLGDLGFRQWQDYERKTPLRNWVSGWAGGATLYLEEPLTPQQGEQMVQIIANANDKYRAGANFSGPVDWNVVESAARQILTPAQFRLFTTTEPPLPTGGRFQHAFYDRVLAASALETKAP